MSDKKARRKPKYKSPVVVPLGELSRGIGYCAAGSHASPGYCSAGPGAATACTAGITATTACTAGTGF